MRILRRTAVLGLSLTTLVVTACAADVGGSASTSTTAAGTDSSTRASAPSSSAASSMPTDALSVVELPIAMGRALRAGSYTLSDFPVGITFEIAAFEPPAEWIACSEAPVEQAVCHFAEDDTLPAAVAFQIVDNVRTPPCGDQETAVLLDPPVGPSVDDLVTAISELEGYEATPPEAITLSGFSGQEFTLTAQAHGCGATWATSERVTGMGVGEVNLLRIIDVDGVRVMIANAYHPGETPDAAVEAAEHVLGSVQIES